MPLLWLSTAFLLGILLGSVTSLSKTVILSIFILCALLAFLERRFTPRVALLQHWRRISPLPLAVLIAALALGAWRYPAPAASLPTGSIASFNGQGEITFSAVVSSLPVETDQTLSFSADLTAGSHSAALAPSSGRIQVQGWPGGGIAYGDLVQITGKPETPPEEETFSYREYLARKGILSLVSFPSIEVVSHGHGNPVLALLYSLRLRGYEAISSILPQPQAALLSGILLGLDQDLPDALTGAFQETGTAHIIAISGFNIAIISAFFFWALRRVASRWKAAFFSILAVFLYALLVGAEPAVMRAAIMGGMAILGTQIGRRGSGLNTLVFTAAVMCLFDPLLLWDVSFQLSFAATLGLVVVGNPWLRGFTAWLEQRLPSEKARRIADPVGEYLLLTLAAQIATLPLMAWHFHQLSLTALVANPLILPAQPLIMTLGAVAMLSGMLFRPLGVLFGWLVLPLLSYTIAIVEGLARLPGSIRISQSGFDWILLIFGIAVALFLLARRFPSQAKPAVILTVCGLLAIVAWMAAIARPDGRLHVTLLALEGGHGVLIRTPRGQHYLLNGAPSGRELVSTLDRSFSPFDRDLDGLILTEPQSKPIGGLNFLAEQMQVDAVLWGANVPAGSATRRLEDALRGAGSQSTIVESGQVYELEPGLTMRVLGTSEEGTALIVDYGNFSLLLPGGIPPGMLARNLRPRAASVIILAANDLAAAPVEEWNRLNPMAFFWNETLAPAPDPLWVQTAQHGQVELSTDGTQLYLEGSE